MKRVCTVKAIGVTQSYLDGCGSVSSWDIPGFVTLVGWCEVLNDFRFVGPPPMLYPFNFDPQNRPHHFKYLITIGIRKDNSGI